MRRLPAVGRRSFLSFLIAQGAFAAADQKKWEGERARILSSMQEVMGPLPPSPKAFPDAVATEEQRFPLFTRKRITFDSGDGDRVPAWLFLPHRKNLRGAAALCLHQTTKIGKDEPAGIGGKPNLHYALELAEMGFTTLAPDYPNFGEYKVDPYAIGYSSATMKGIRNHRRAVDLLSSMPEVDARRIGVIGHSLGGHNSLFVAAFDPRIAAAVTSCGFTSFPKYYGGDLTGWSHRGYMPKIATVYGKSPAKMPFDFSQILAAIAPRSVFINAPLHDSNFDVSGVDDCVRAAREMYANGSGRKPKFVVSHPDCKHDFPVEVRQRSYRFLIESLRAG